MPVIDKYLLHLKLISSHSIERFTLTHSVKINSKEKGSLDSNVFPKFHQLYFIFFNQFLTDRAQPGNEDILLVAAPQPVSKEVSTYEYDSSRLC